LVLKFNKCTNACQLAGIFVLRLKMKKKKYPKCFADLSRNELVQIMPMLIQLQHYGGDYDSVVFIFREVLGVLAARISHFESLSDRAQSVKVLSDGEVLVFMNRFSWLLTERIEKKPFDFVLMGGLKYFLPEPNFSDTSGIELAMCNIYYLKFTEVLGAGSLEKTHPAFQAPLPGGDFHDRSAEYLCNLLAIICRPNRAKKREVYDSDVSEARVAVFKDLPVGEAYCILQYWSSMNALFMKMYSEVFSPASDSGDDDAGLFENGEGWLATLEDIAKDGVHGDFDKVCDKNVHTLWMYLKHQKIMADARQSKQKD
jgi:hypothetical protein